MGRIIRLAMVLLGAACALAACTNESVIQGTDLPEMDLAGFQDQLESSDRPAVVNVWASWCLPCRDEAPLFASAHAEYGDRVDFYGIAYNDNQPGARQFLAEFDLPFTHYFDFDGDALVEFGGIGVPRTYFFASGGILISTHNGVIDDETLTRQIEELLGR
jgi:cytochrome c biogenesis protein CcmG/thiol:disulfide interchange protein DsbE